MNYLLLSTCGVLLLWQLLQLHRSRVLARKIAELHRALDIHGPAADPHSTLEQCFEETVRRAGALSTFEPERSLTPGELGPKLCSIIDSAFRTLKARAVELALFHGDTGQWSQIYFMGTSTSVESQAFLASESTERETRIFSHGKAQLAIAPLVFSGVRFGQLRVEFPDGYVPTPSDSELITLYARQAAFSLIDAQFNDQMIRMQQASEESVRAKTGFLANLSHEIRGPLGIILNGVELITDGLLGEVSEPQQTTLGMVKKSGDHLLELVNDVLDYAKVEAGKVVTKPVSIPLEELLSDLCAVVRQQATSKNHQLVLDPVDHTLGVECDRRHARQILINFLTNAIKYTPEGGKITVSASRLPNGRAKIAVADSGVGIPHDQRDRVFSAFERVDHAYSEAQAGSGLGMPLARRLAEINGGSVDFESEPGKGSTFWLILRGTEIERQQPAEDSNASAENAPPKGHGETILLVDQMDESASNFVQTYLESQGFRIVRVEEPRDVIRALRDRPVELAVVENDLPNFPGEEAVSMIRSQPQSLGVPIILLSARAFVFDIERFLKLGVDRCLPKPVPLAELAATARRLIDETGKPANRPAEEAVGESVGSGEGSTGEKPAEPETSSSDLQPGG